MNAADIIAQARKARRTALDEPTGKAFLAAFGIRAPRSVVVTNADAALEAAAGLTPPFAVKVVASGLTHKSDSGGVRLGIEDPRGAQRAIAHMASLPAIKAAAVEGWLIEEMAPQGAELIVGAFHDVAFGPMLMVGSGGIFAEIVGDVAFRICPVTRREANQMLASLKAAKLLDGARGRPKLPTEAVVEALMNVGGPNGLMMQLGHEIGELDINPLIVSSCGAWAGDVRIALAHPGAEGGRGRGITAEQPGAGPSWRRLFEPRTIAVVGASSTGASLANTFITRLKAFGFDGEIYPIHPAATAIEGLPAFPSLALTPQPVDYAYIAIAAERVAAVLDAAKGHVAFAQVISSGFAETPGGAGHERELAAAARAAGIRVVGPNCLGTYCPKGKLTFVDKAAREPGSIGIIAQSGGLTTSIIKYGQFRGLRFSAAVSAGNCTDIAPADLLAHFLADAPTRAIGCYLEDIKDGRRFFELLRGAPAPKPVVLLCGGRTRQGRAAAASHTGALASASSGYAALAAQTPSAIVETLDEFVDALVALQSVRLRPERPTRRVVLFGNGGGASVLGADLFAARGLEVAPLPGEALRALEALQLPPGSSIANPIDAPVATLQQEGGRIAERIVEIVLANARPDALAVHLNLSSFAGRRGVDPIDTIFTVLAATSERHASELHTMLALRSDDDPELEARKRDYRERARAIGIAVFDDLPQLAHALGCVSHLEMRLAAANGH